MKGWSIPTIVFTACAILFSSGIAWAQAPQPDASTNAAVRYTQAKSLDAFIGQLKLKPGAAGDLYLAKAKAREECAVLGVLPAYADDAIRHLKNTPSPDARIRIDMYERLGGRCRGFGQTTSQDLADVPRLYKQAAGEGNTAAMAHLLVAESAHMQPHAVLHRALGIIHTKDPAAIFELGILFGEGGSLKLSHDIDIGANPSVAAWHLVACHLGYDCAYSSSLVQQSCLFGGLCGSGGYADNLRDSSFSPRQFRDIVDAVNRLTEAIGEGNVAKFISTHDDEQIADNTPSKH